MAIDVKICGLNAPEAVNAAMAGGARYAGFNFYPPSPRAVNPAQAAALAAPLSRDVMKVGVVVDPDDETLGAILAAAPLDLIQLHGAESPRRVAEIRARFERPVMKVFKVSGPEDLAAVAAFVPVADLLMFDTKAPKHLKHALPGGNAVAFDWRILAGRTWPRPWLLAGGLDADNVGEAVAIAGARAVDVSSGVEERPGVKSAEKITAFLTRASAI